MVALWKHQSVALILCCKSQICNALALVELYGELLLIGLIVIFTLILILFL